MSVIVGQSCLLNIFEYSLSNNIINNNSGPSSHAVAAGGGWVGCVRCVSIKVVNFCLFFVGTHWRWLQYSCVVILAQFYCLSVLLLPRFCLWAGMRHAACTYNVRWTLDVLWAAAECQALDDVKGWGSILTAGDNYVSANRRGIIIYLNIWMTSVASRRASEVDLDTYFVKESM